MRSKPTRNQIKYTIYFDEYRMSLILRAIQTESYCAMLFRKKRLLNTILLEYICDGYGVSVSEDWKQTTCKYWVTKLSVDPALGDRCQQTLVSRSCYRLGHYDRKGIAVKAILIGTTQEVDKSAIDAPVLRGKGGGAIFCVVFGVALRAAAAYETRGAATILPPPPSSSARPFGVLACPLLQPTTFTLPSFFILPCFSSFSAATKKIMLCKRNRFLKSLFYKK